jgi:hypothetical protein
MVDLLPTCVKCGSHVADSVEPEVEKGGQVKVGHYVNSVWMCDDCLKQTEGFGIASPADVSPNTQRADEADVT